MILIWQGYASEQQDVRNLTLILVILSAAKDLTDRSDTGRVAGVRSFAEARRLLRATQDDRKARLWMPSQHKEFDTYAVRRLKRS
jgi:hypothetical protein